MNILLAEASPYRREDVRHCLLRWEGLDITEADSPAGMTAQTLADGFALIIAGVQDAEEEWLHELRETRQQNRMTPIILIVPQTRPDLAIAGIRIGVSDYLLSPFSCRSLQHRLAKWLGPPSFSVPQPLTTRHPGPRTGQSATN